ncbi:unnamed protein product, partial [Gulo gulo]
VTERPVCGEGSKEGVIGPDQEIRHRSQHWTYRQKRAPFPTKPRSVCSI